MQPAWANLLFIMIFINSSRDFGCEDMVDINHIGLNEPGVDRAFAHKHYLPLASLKCRMVC